MTATELLRSRRDGGDDDDGGAGSRIPHRKLILAAMAVVLVAAAVTWVVAFSSVLGVRTVDVRGVHILNANQVRAAAKIDNGAPLVRLDTDGIRTRVEKLPDIASVKVMTSFPSTVIITVTERVAVGMLRSGTSGDNYLLVDRTGDQFRTVADRPANLPLFVIPKGTSARTTGRAVATVAASLSAKLRSRIESIQALDPQAITLLLTNGRVVQWGSADRSTQKARILPALLKQDGQQLDVSDPDQPFTR
jgi:cell division protein FtsQ